MSPDLRLATIYVMPLGGRDAERGGRRVRAPQEIPARRDRAPRQPEIRARHPLPHRRAVRRSRAHRQAAASPAVKRDLEQRTTSERRRIDAMTLAASPQAPQPPAARRRPRRKPKQFKRDKRDVHGWVVLDKPVGMTSTHAVSVIKRLFTRQTRRPCRHARSARLRRAADRARRGDQDRSVRDGRPQALSLHRALGRGTRHRRRRGPRHRQTSDERPTAGGDPRAAAGLYRHHPAGAAALFRHQDRGRARLRSRPRRRDRRT